METLTAKVNIPSIEGLNELIEIYSLYRFAKLQTVMRQVSKRLFHSFDIVEFFVSKDLIAKGYKHPRKIAELWKLKCDYRVFAQWTPDRSHVHFRAGYNAPSFCFISELYRELVKPDIRAVDIKLKNIPPGYNSTITSKLARKLGEPILRIDLGEIIRFTKTQKPKLKKQKQ